jgi:hypothetical protein
MVLTASAAALGIVLYIAHGTIVSLNNGHRARTSEILQGLPACQQGLSLLRKMLLACKQAMQAMPIAST